MLKAVTIAGFDSSNGAGITRDTLEFSRNDIYNASICTAITIQNNNRLASVRWLPMNEILAQIDIIAEQESKHSPFQFVKIGIVESLEILEEIILYIREINPSATILWDPILASSSNFSFHQSLNLDVLHRVLLKIDWITPNKKESEQLQFNPRNIAEFSAKWVVKGYEQEGNQFNDAIFIPNQTPIFVIGRKLIGDRHGTGCVFSTNFMSQIMKGYTPEESLMRAKERTTHYIQEII